MTKQQMASEEGATMSGKTVWIKCDDGTDNPVECHIHPRDVTFAVAKWETKVGASRVFVKQSASRGRHNKVYA
jgi:hypothetical protein